MIIRGDIKKVLSMYPNLAGYGYGDGFGYGFGFGDGDGYGDGFGDGDGYGDGYGYDPKKKWKHNAIKEIK